MAIEIEKKYKLTSAQRVEILATFKQLGAKFSHEDFEVNELYGGGILKRKQAVLRIRKIAGKTLLTYKERIKSLSSIKHQIEHETEISDDEAIEQIIQSLGFKRIVVYEKKRQTWHLNNVEIVLDELPFGFYMEIEGSEREIAMTERLLNAVDLQTEPDTYPYLTLNLGQKKGKIFEARF